MINGLESFLENDFLQQEGLNFQSQAEGIIQELKQGNYSTLLDVYNFLWDLEESRKITRELAESKTADLDQVSQDLAQIGIYKLFSFYYPKRDFPVEFDQYSRSHRVETIETGLLNNSQFLSQMAILPSDQIVATVRGLNNKPEELWLYDFDGSREQIAQLDGTKSALLTLPDGRIITAGGTILACHAFNKATCRWESETIFDAKSIGCREGQAMILELLSNNRFLMNPGLDSTFLVEYVNGAWRYNALQIEHQDTHLTSTYLRSTGSNSFYNVSATGVVEYVHIKDNFHMDRQRISPPSEVRMIEPLPGGKMICVNKEQNFYLRDLNLQTNKVLECKGTPLKFSNLIRILKSVDENKFLVNNIESIGLLDATIPSKTFITPIVEYRSVNPPMHMLADGTTAVASNVYALPGPGRSDTEYVIQIHKR